MPPPLHLLGVNGSLRGATGRSAAMLRRALDAATARGAATRTIDLATYGADAAHTVEAMTDALAEANAIVVATGTYWGAPSSLVQRWLEVLTFTEGGAVWRGKGAGVIATMHSVGGLEAAQRVATTLGLLGATIPGAGVVVLADHAGADADTWVPDDLDTLVHNVLAVAAARPDVRHWPVDAYPPLRGAWPVTGPLWALANP